ncbi:hypothetical protein KIN20_012117 [Parelaphostrongylus tenuis]|uniref:Uncharacterized protein n=1 Tax=Parelaphostrongylus tenuis TaxID=148309 RepID=A0AAD5MAF4_PARTN|nr:hypothetical protein KIN20_012117 [Parelaphostrongylus tenuis]
MTVVVRTIINRVLLSAAFPNDARPELSLTASPRSHLRIALERHRLAPLIQNGDELSRNITETLLHMPVHL